jgi:DNA-binding MarR family transcriptional regulator
MSLLRDPKKHDDLLNYQLKMLVKIGGAPAIRLCEGSFGVSRQEWRIIAALTEDGPMSPSELAQRCSPLEPGAISKLVSSLTNKKLILRVRSSDDKRHATVEVSAAGAQLYAELFPQLAGINRRIMSVLDESEALLLEDFLKRLTARAHQIHDDGDGVDARADRRLGGSRRLWD